MRDFTHTCGCGEPLHYSNPDAQAAVQRLVDQFGDTVVVTVKDGAEAYRVPRHYIALHGLKAMWLGFVANEFGWEKVQ